MITNFLREDEETNEIVAIQTEYSPHIETGLYGKLTATNPKVFTIHTQKILFCYYCATKEKLLGLSFHLRDGTVMKYGLAPKIDDTHTITEVEENSKNKYEEFEEYTKKEEEAEEEKPQLPDGAETERVDFPIYDRIVRCFVYGSGKTITGIGFQILV